MQNLGELLRRATMLLILAAACGGGSSDAPDASVPCSAGATECRADGLYTCDAAGAFQRTEACAACETTPVPHCARSCGDPGVTSICQGDSILSCANSTTSRCDPGTCLPAGNQAVCATRPNTTTCAGRIDGMPYDLLCADANGISKTQACDLRTGQCVDAQYDCATLTTVPANSVACDASSGNYYTSCTAGQPAALACADGSACATDGTFNCYSPATNGATCGGPTVCAPGLHCTQAASASSTCIQPAGQLACNSTDVLAVCTDADTGFACVKGAVWRWNNLTSWGGSCTSNHVNLPVGGTCIPGLADCQQGLACDKSVFDVAGTCRVPPPNAPPECTLTGQASTGLSCIFEWHACADGRQYEVNCRRQNIGGNVITICECSVNGAVTKTFGGTAVCMATDIQMLDQQAMTNCGWNVTTVDVAP